MTVELTRRMEREFADLQSRHGRKKSPYCLCEGVRCCSEVLAAVEETSRAVTDADTGAKGKKKPEVKDDTLISFEDVANEQVINELKAVDLNTISPLECMSFLFDLKKRLQ